MPSDDRPGPAQTARELDSPSLVPPGEVLASLPPAERLRRRREILLSSLTLVTIFGIALYQQRTNGAETLLVIAVNLFLIFLLFYLVARNLVKLVLERRRGALGSHLNLKFVLAVVAIATVPTAVLLVVSSLLVSASIDRWFGPQIEQTLERTRTLGSTAVDWADDHTRLAGRRIAEQINEDRLLKQENHEALKSFVQQMQRFHDLGVVEVFSAAGELLVSQPNPESSATHFSQPGSDLVAAALGGQEVVQVEDGENGPVVRMAVPVMSTFRQDEVVGAVLVNYAVPAALTEIGRQVAAIDLDFERFKERQGESHEWVSAYRIEFLLFSVVVLLLAVWLGLRLAKGVTTPIRALAEGTAEVARGNLDAMVETTSNDEIGFLVRSFNRMTRDLKEARSGLERSNAEIEQRRSYMEIVLRNIGAGVVSLDAEGRILTINPSAERLLGVPPGVGVVGAPLDQVLPQPEQRKVVRELGAQLRAGVRESIRRQVRLPHGDDVLTLLVTMTLLKDEDGETVGFVVVFDDYSQLVKVQRMEAWQEVARRIAHEIKNPLTPIQLSAQRIRRRFGSRLRGRPEDAKVFDECVDAITGQVESLKLLVNEFSNFARLPAANPRPDDLNRIVREAAARYAGTEGVKLETHLDPALPSVEVDREQFGRLLTNLIDNAVAAIRERAELEPGYRVGRIELRTVHDAALHAVRLEVVDDGVGIPTAHRRRIFEPYFSTKEHGTGLGLAIVSRIVADHRGYVRAHVLAPHGTRMIVEMPAQGVALRAHAFGGSAA
jgi:two-component system nitrogen regulation sensor histidine kinase NtrY